MYNTENEQDKYCMSKVVPERGKPLTRIKGCSEDRSCTKFELKDSSSLFKFKKKSLDYLYKKLNLILMLGILHGRVYLRVQLKKIQLSKELFMIELQGNSHVYIPKDLSLMHLPMSYRYYDPVLTFIQMMIP